MDGKWILEEYHFLRKLVREEDTIARVERKTKQRKRLRSE